MTSLYVHESKPGQKLAMVAQHLNAAIGNVVRPEHIAAALRSGTLSCVKDRDAASAIAWLFVEISPSLISDCTREAGASIASANRLYAECIAINLPRVSAWEQSTGDSA
jgi:hypothetical protein